MRPTDVITDLDLIDPSDTASVGGKAANLKRLRDLDGVDVPDGFCVTAAAFAAVLEAVPEAERLRRTLSLTGPGDADALRSAAAHLREALVTTAVPDVVASAIEQALSRFPSGTAFAVRSSATTEDTAGASSAGQHDSHLDVVGSAAVIDAVRRCWASLFSERALTYRGGRVSDGAAMAVVVQVMVPAQASGVLFTADPVSGDRRTTAIEAVRGLGEAFVSGRVQPETYRVRDGQVTSPDPEARVLTTALVTRLAQLGRRIETALGCPQDVEWCLRDDHLFVVQSRPITTLFPVPPQDDDTYRVYLSVGHQQMMTDPITPLGLSCWQMTTPAPMAEAGHRLWVDVTARLAAPSNRDGVLQMARGHDPLLLDALTTVLDGGRLPNVEETDDATAGTTPVGSTPDDDLPPEPDPAIVAELVARADASIAASAKSLASVSGPDVFAALRDDWLELRRTLFDPDGRRVYMPAMASTAWLNEHLAAWLGETNAADVLTRGVDHNPTSAMGLALLDVADAVRPHPEVIDHLITADDHTLLAGLDALPGGAAARAALESWLTTYGARGPGEIDIVRPRWIERPTMLMPLLLGHVRDAQPGEAVRRFDDARREAERWERDLLRRLGELPDGAARVEATRRHIAVVRAYIGHREFPKYAMVRRYWIYKQALLREAVRLVHAGVLRTVDDASFLRFDELEQAARSGHADLALVDRRRADHLAFAALTPPRVLTSDGEALTGSYRRTDVPAGALVGLPVSSGTVTGRARVVLDPAGAHLDPGDVLVTRFTDPSWTPLFVSAAALVTEVGGLMTHGAVVAREYGLPAVVSVDGATTLIRDGELIRVDGARGWVERLPAG